MMGDLYKAAVQVNIAYIQINPYRIPIFPLSLCMDPDSGCMISYIAGWIFFNFIFFLSDLHIVLYVFVTIMVICKYFL